MHARAVSDMRIALLALRRNMSPLDLRMQAEYADVRTIGIPRALLYYRYKTMWRTFFEELGRTVVVSAKSDRSTLETGAHLSIDECCLASKLYMGHVASLLGTCDAIFAPSIDNLGDFKGFCTKFQALPDLVANTFSAQKPRIVSCEVDHTETHITEQEAFIELGQKFGASKKEAKKAYAAAVHAQKKTDEKRARKQADLLKSISKLPEGERPLRILVAAHPYVIHDAFVGAPLVDMLHEMGACVLFADRCNHEKALEKSFEFSDTLPWIVNREVIGAILGLYDQIDGIVLMSAFPCGPDSMTNDALMRCIKGKPILSLTIDAQSGTAGLETRIESFVDILNYQQRGGYLHE